MRTLFNSRLTDHEFMHILIQYRSDHDVNLSSLLTMGSFSILPPASIGPGRSRSTMTSLFILHPTISPITSRLSVKRHPMRGSIVLLPGVLLDQGSCWVCICGSSNAKLLFLVLGKPCVGALWVSALTRSGRETDISLTPRRRNHFRRNLTKFRQPSLDVLVFWVIIIVLLDR